MHTGRMPCEHEGRNWGDASTSQGTPVIGSKPSEARTEAWSSPPLAPSEGALPCPYLDLVSLVSRDNSRTVYSPLSLWCFVLAALANSYSRKGVSQEKREWGIESRVEDEKTEKKKGHLPNLCGRKELNTFGDVEPGSEGR